MKRLGRELLRIRTSVTESYQDMGNTSRSLKLAANGVRMQIQRRSAICDRWGVVVPSVRSPFSGCYTRGS